MSIERSGRYWKAHLGHGYRRPVRLDGMHFDQSTLRFDREQFTLFQAGLVAAASSGKMVRIDRELAAPGGHAPDASDVEIINKYHTTRKFAADDLYLMHRYPVNTVPSRTWGLQFTRAALEKFAADGTHGVSRLLHHNHTEITGRVYGAEVIDAEIRGFQSTWLKTSEYIPVHESNEPARLKIDSGLFSSDSIGFYPGSQIDFVEFDPGDGNLIQVIRIDHVEEQFPVEMREVSFVHLGEIKAVGSNQDARELAGVDVSAGQPNAVDVSGNLTEPQTLNPTSIWHACI